MSAPIAYRSLTLGLYPTARGFAWVAFSSPFAPHDWGYCRLDKGPRHQKNERCLARIEKLLRRLEPEALILESFDERSAIQSPRLQRLSKSLAALASDRSLSVSVYTRTDVKKAFEPVGAVSRHEIACTISRQVPALRDLLPNKRKRWEGQDKRLSIFNAAALVLTHYAFGANDLFEYLKQVA